MTANPDGTFTATSDSRPVRVKKNGAWTPIDTALVTNADGSLSPKASLAQVTFSPGGTGAAVTVTSPDGTKAIALSLPETLPAPQVTANIALYPNVLPGVDLRLAATGDSYTEVLVIHDATSAANPALSALKMQLHATGITISQDADKALTGVDASGNEVFQAPQPIMWDSHSDQHAGPTPTPDNPGSGIVTQLPPSISPAPASLATKATSTSPTSNTDVTMSPPASALSGSNVTYPVYIDPGFDLYQQYWTELDDHGGQDWDNNTQNAKVGYCDYLSCLSPYRTMRAYYQMDTGYLSQGNGTHATIYEAHFYITQVWNGANGCTATPVDLYSAGPINSGTAWPGPAISMLDRVSSGAGNGCASASLSFNALSWVQSAAAGWWPNTTFALRADTESNDQQWKQFDNKAQLSVVYSYPPNTPDPPAMLNTVNCNGVNYTSNSAPTFTASATDNNPQPLNLDLNFDVRDLTNLPFTHGTASNTPSGITASWQSGALPNAQFQARVNATNLPGTPAQPQTSAWSGWYPFTVLNENLQGITPTVTSFDFPQDSYGNAQWGAPQGRGQFLIAGTRNNNVIGYQYSIDNNIQDAPPTCGLTKPGTSVPVGNGGTAVISIPSAQPPGFGHHRLYVRGFDIVGQPTNTAAYDFMVGLTVMPSTANLPATGAVHNPYLGKCLDDLNRTLGNLATVDLTGCNNSAAQVWSLKSDGSLQTGDQTNGWWCLDVDNASTAQNTPVHLHQCNGGGSQKWTANADGQGDWQLVNPESGLCLDDPNASTTNGTAFEIHTCNGSPAQKWIVDVNPNRYEGQDAITNVTVTNGNAPGVQGDVGGVTFVGDNQLLWFSNGTGATITIPFTVSTEADYALGIRMSKSYNYGQETFTLDDDTQPLTPASLSPSGVFDGFSATCCASQYIPLGGRHLTVGSHKLTLTVTGKYTPSSGTGSSGYGMGIDFFEVAPFANVTVDSFQHSLNNHGISDDSAPNSANIDLTHPAGPGDVGGTGTGDSLSRQALAAAGLTPSKNFTLDGVNFSLPAANGSYDNTISMGQTVTLDKNQQIRANAVAFLVAAVNGGTPADSLQQRITSTINYSGGGKPDVKPMPAVSDWCTGPAASAAYVLAYRNASTGSHDTSCPVRIYMVVVPVHPNNAVQSVSLPYYGTDATPGTHNPALHVLAIGVRPAATANLPTSADVSGNNHPLTLNGRVGFDNASQKNGAAVFDGSGGNAATASSVVDTTQSFSIAAWVNAASLGSSYQVMVVQQGTNVGGLYLQYNGSVWEFTREDGDVNGTTSQSAYSDSPAATGWTHLVGTWDATSGTMILYVNGVAQKAVVVEKNAMPSTGPLVIGRGFLNGVPTSPFTGEITDVQAYQRVLSASDASTLFNDAPTSALATPAGWWQLEDFGRNWTGAWAAQPDGLAPAATPSLSGMTIRQVVHPSDLGFGSVNTLINGQYNTDIAGNATGPETSPVQTRIRLTNRFSTSPVTINAATIAAQTSAAGAATGTQTPLTFGSPTTTSVTINPGDEVTSDPVTLPNTASGSGNLVVSLALASGTGTPPVSNQLTNPAYPVYLATGDQSADTAGAGATWSTNGNLTGRYWLSGIDVTDVNDPQVNTRAATGPGTIAVLGDQTTGAGDTTDTTWVDMLGKDPQIFNPPFDPNNGPGPNPGGFVNISNNGASVAGADSQFGAAPNATVLDEPNLKAVLLTLGLNDIKSGASASTIETNINTLVSSLSPYGITNHYNPDGIRAVSVYLATVPDAPGLTAAQETERNNLNTCIKTQGANCAVKILFSGTSGAGAASGFVDIAAAIAGAGSNPTQAQINTAILTAVKGSPVTNW